MLHIGIDIGTSKICGVALREGRVIERVSEPNSYSIVGEPYEMLQDAEKISDAVLRIFRRLAKGEKTTVGLTGQMHGVLYVKDGRAISPLFTWQDRRGNLTVGNKSYAELFSERSGYPLSTGYGLVTHCCLNGKFEGKLSTIHAYLAMMLAGRKEPVLHRSDAASLGFYNIEKDCFDSEALSRCGDPRALPAVCGDEMLGNGVAAAIGDNQASVFDALGTNSGLCVNIGTGSQVSAIVEAPIAGVDNRPYVGGKYLAIHGALCGGRAFALLEGFFREALNDMGLTGDVYAMLDRLAARAEGSVKCVPTFAGTRDKPQSTGSFLNVTDRNFTPGEFARAVLIGMAEELHSGYLSMKDNLPAADKIVCSGNGARKNPLFLEILSKTFDLPVCLAPHEEEAAAGAAQFAAEVAE